MGSRCGSISLVIAGIVLGLLGALALTKLMSSLLYGVTPSDPMTFGLVALFIDRTKTTLEYRCPSILW
jgi:hypothetical protein